VARNVASARLHLGEIPQAVTARAAGPGPRRRWPAPGPWVKRWPAGVLLAGGSGSGPPHAREDWLAAPRSR